MMLPRRSFLGVAAATALTAARKPLLPVGIELYAVRDELSKDLMGTVRAVAKMGYEVVEFYSPYYQWTADYSRQVRKTLDDAGVRCLSTHNSAAVFTPEALPKAMELNQIIGSKTLVMASAGRVSGIDGWKTVADRLTQASGQLKSAGMRAGFHNHKIEFVAIDGQRPMDVLAGGTPKDVTLQFDVGTRLEAGQDPVAWIEAHPGRIRSTHLKDWGANSGAERGFRVLFGEGDVPWKKVLAAAESKGGAEYHLIEQEGSRFSSLESAQKCLDAYRRLRGVKS
ncbi:MAG: sugar phosphate isomerase/epimerase [Acidobacteria bacterium]|nr:sugar phosphate isomerase/epimerase [Acidobacteriota bacterium]